MTTHEYLLNKYGVTISFQDAAKELGLYWQTVRVMCARGEIQAIKAGRKWVLTTKALAEYLDGKTQKEQESIINITNAPTRGRNKHKKIV